MTQEEKARAYDEAIERAKLELNSPDKRLIEYIFPELKESDGDRVRKEIIDFATKANNGFTSILANNYNFNKWIAWLENQQGEHKPAWSEEDEDILDGIIEDIEVLKEEESNKDVKAAYQRELNWLKSLKERVLPQPKQEWREEDAYKIDKITKVLDYVSNKNNLVIGQIEIEDLKNWLKSLRPQNRWKPSDEQMEYLSAAIEESNENPVLDSLYQDLKKL